MAVSRRIFAVEKKTTQIMKHNFALQKHSPLLRFWADSEEENFEEPTIEELYEMMYPDEDSRPGDDEEF